MLKVVICDNAPNDNKGYLNSRSNTLKLCDRRFYKLEANNYF